MKTLSYLLLAAFLCAFVVGCQAEIGSGNPNPPPEPGSHDEAAGNEAGEGGEATPDAGE